MSENAALTPEEQAAVTIVRSGGDEKYALIVCAACERLAQENARLREEVQKWQRIRTPTHGSCCTCQKCGQFYDDCRCDLDEVVDDLKQAEALAARYKAALERYGHHSAYCSRMVYGGPSGLAQDLPCDCGLAAALAEEKP